MNPKPAPSQGPAPITTEQLQAWIVRRERFRSRIKTVLTLVLVVGIGAFATIWTLFHEQLLVTRHLRSLGFQVDWDVNPTNLYRGGVTSVAYSQRGYYWNERVKPADIKSISKLLHLETLDLGTLDTFNDGDLAFLADLKELTELQLHRSPGYSKSDQARVKLTDAVTEHIKGLTRLKSLSLADNPITDRGIARLAHLTELESLDLDNTRITDAALETFKAFKRLKSLRIVDTKVTKAGVAAFQRAMPNTEVTSVKDPIGPGN